MLLQREREHFDLRLQYDRMAVWLSLGQALPEIFLDWKGTRQQLWDRVRKTLISRLRLQRVLVLSRGTDVRLRLRRDGQPVSLSVTPQLQRSAA